MPSFNLSLRLIGAFMPLALLGACGKSADAPKAAVPAPAATATTPANDPARYAAPTLPRQALQPVAAYAEMAMLGSVSGAAAIEATHEQYRRAYWSGAEPDLPTLAYDLLPEYRREKDDFKRQDLVKARQAELEAAHAGFKDKGLLALDIGSSNSGVTVGRYDPTLQGFTLSVRHPESTVYLWRKPNEAKLHPGPQWGIRLVGAHLSATYGEPPIVYKPASEEEARRIESQLSELRDSNHDTLSVRVAYLGHVAGAQKAATPFEPYTALVVVDGLAVRHPKTGDVIFTAGAKELGGTATVTCASTVKALNLRMPEARPLTLAETSHASGKGPVGDC